MLSKFNLEFTELFDNISTLNNECVLAGDYNIDLLKQTNTETAAFTELLQSYLTTPMITIPTRYSDDKMSLIDNIFYNNYKGAGTSGVILSDLSDHLPVFFHSRKLCKEANN